MRSDLCRPEGIYERGEEILTVLKAIALRGCVFMQGNVNYGDNEPFLSLLVKTN